MSKIRKTGWGGPPCRHLDQMFLGFDKSTFVASEISIPASEPAS